MSLLGNIMAETLKSTGKGMNATLREQAQEAREKALMRERAEVDLETKKAAVDYERELDKGRYSTVDTKHGLMQVDSHSGKQSLLASKPKKSALAPAVSEKVGVLKSELQALSKVESPSELQKARIAMIHGEIDHLLGFKSPQKPPSLADLMGQKTSNKDAVEEAPRQSFTDRLQTQQEQARESAQNQQQLQTLDLQLKNIAADLPVLRGVALPSGGGLLAPAYKASPEQNKLSHYLQMLDNIAANGTDEQKARAEHLFSQLNAR